jgi:HEPN domain-containing protein
LTAFGTEFPRTHDLTELHVLLPPTIAAGVDIADLAELNPYAVRARYPGPWEPQTREDARRAVEIAQRVREVVRSKMPAQILEFSRDR